jgi:hypothetical protein
MDDVLRIVLTTAGSLGTLAAAAYAVVRMLRQDSAWERLLKAKDAEIERLNRLLEEKEQTRPKSRKRT